MVALVRGRLRDLSIVGLVHGYAGLRSAPDADVTTATKLALRSLARWILELEAAKWPASGPPGIFVRERIRYVGPLGELKRWLDTAGDISVK